MQIVCQPENWVSNHRPHGEQTLTSVMWKPRAGVLSGRTCSNLGGSHCVITGSGQPIAFENCHASFAPSGKGIPLCLKQVGEWRLLNQTFLTPTSPLCSPPGELWQIHLLTCSEIIGTAVAPFLTRPARDGASLACAPPISTQSCSHHSGGVWLLSAR